MKNTIDSLYYSAIKIREIKDFLIKFFEKQLSSKNEESNDIKEKILNITEKKLSELIRFIEIKIEDESKMCFKAFQIDYKWWSKKNEHGDGYIGTEVVKTKNIFQAKQIIENYPYNKWDNVIKLKIISIKEIDKEFHSIEEI